MRAIPHSLAMHNGFSEYTQNKEIAIRAWLSLSIHICLDMSVHGVGAEQSLIGLVYRLVTRLPDRMWSSGHARSTIGAVVNNLTCLFY